MVPGTGHASLHTWAGRRHRRRLGGRAGCCLSTAGQAVAALLTGSLALLSDAGHMFTDVLGIAMALAAIPAAGRAPTTRSARSGSTGWRCSPPSPTRCC